MKKANCTNSNAGFYSPYIISGNQMYISGQRPIKPGNTKAVEGGIAMQTLQTLSNIEVLLKAENLTREDVVVCRIYTTSIDYWNEINSAYASFFGSHKPARIVVPVLPLSDNCELEIEAIAELQTER